MQPEEVKRENQRLALQVRRLQDVVSAMRDEIADANAEIVASRRLHDEQKSVLLQELHRERSWREQMQRQAAGPPKNSQGTNTILTSDELTSDATMMTDEACAQHGLGFFGGYPHLGGGGTETSAGVGGADASGYPTPPTSNLAVLPPYDEYGYPVNSPYYHYPVGTAPQLVTTPHHHHQSYPVAHGSSSGKVLTHPGNAYAPPPPSAGGAHQRLNAYGRERLLHEFADSLMRRTNYHATNLFNAFKSLGATSVDEVCATVTEHDLVAAGIPILKARGMIHLIAEHTHSLLGTEQPQHSKSTTLVGEGPTAAASPYSMNATLY